jgi:hypothetical protein
VDCLTKALFLLLFPNKSLSFLVYVSTFFHLVLFRWVDPIPQPDSESWLVHQTTTKTPLSYNNCISGQWDMKRSLWDFEETFLPHRRQEKKIPFQTLDTFTQRSWAVVTIMSWMGLGREPMLICQGGQRGKRGFYITDQLN